MKPIRPIRQTQGKQAQSKRVYSGIREEKKQKDSDYFDDCYVCQYTKKAEKKGKNLSAEELKEVFQKANEQN